MMYGKVVMVEIATSVEHRGGVDRGKFEREWEGYVSVLTLKDSGG